MHTPGPWFVDQFNTGNWLVWNGEYGKCSFGIMGFDEFPLTEDDAHLIGSAPDLKQLGVRTISFLNALPGQNADEQYFTDWFKGAMKFREEWKQAIAKAKGE